MTVPRTEVARRIALVALGASVGLLAMEGLLAVLLPHANERTTAGLNVFEADAELGYRLRPNVYRELSWIDRPITIVTDAEGRRVPEGGRPPEAGPRLVVAGDSYVFGNEVLAEETFTELLGARLGLTPVNLGVGGYSLDQSARGLTRAIASEPADSVARALLVLFVGNDVEWGASPRPPHVDLNGYLVDASDALPSPLTQMRLWITLNSRAAFLAQRAGRALFAREPRVERAEGTPPRANLSDTPTAAPDRWIYDEARFTADRLAGHRSVLRRLARAAERAEVPVTVAILPERAQVAGELGDLPNRRLRAILAEVGLAAVDLLPPMRRDRAGSDAPLYHDVTFGHLSPAGHRSVAAALARFLSEAPAGS